MKEADIMRLIQLKVSTVGGRVFRNNVGAFQDRRDQWIRYGLGVGTSDLIGWRPVLVTSDMVGKTIAQFCAIEVKSQHGKLTVEQTNFLNAVRSAGGLAIEARGTDDLGDLCPTT